MFYVKKGKTQKIAVPPGHPTQTNAWSISTIWTDANGRMRIFWSSKYIAPWRWPEPMGCGLGWSQKRLNIGLNRKEFLQLNVRLREVCWKIWLSGLTGGRFCFFYWFLVLQLLFSHWLRKCVFFNCKTTQ
jgi:hypothetical protein